MSGKTIVMNTVPNDAPARRLVLRVSDLRLIKPMLQAGVGVRAPVRKTLRQFLTGDLGFDPAYVEGRLQTVFVEGAPVDDFDDTIVSPGCTLALSGAMPGLVGATLRRGGYYARMREGIAYDSGGNGVDGIGVDVPAEQTVVFVKLFNKALEDLAKNFVAGRALLVEGRWLADLPASETLGAGEAIEADAVWLTVTFAD